MVERYIVLNLMGSEDHGWLRLAWIFKLNPLRRSNRYFPYMIWTATVIRVWPPDNISIPWVSDANFSWHGRSTPTAFLLFQFLAGLLRPRYSYANPIQFSNTTDWAILLEGYPLSFFGLDTSGWCLTWLYERLNVWLDYFESDIFWFSYSIDGCRSFTPSAWFPTTTFSPCLGY